MEKKIHLPLIESFKQNPDNFFEEFLDKLYEQNDLEVDVFVEYILVVDFLMKLSNIDSEFDVTLLATSVDLATDHESQISECLDGLQECYQESPSLRTDLSTRKLVQLSEHVGEWFEEIMVFVAELAELPQDLIPWFLNRFEGPFSSDSDLYNGSRTGRSGVASNASTPTEVLWQLSDDKDWEIKWRLAMNPKSPPDLLDKLVRVDDEMAEVIQACVAMNPNTSTSTLMALVEGESVDLRSLASKNQNSSKEIITKAIALGLTEKPFNRWGSGLAWVLDDN